MSWTDTLHNKACSLLELAQPGKAPEFADIKKAILLIADEVDEIKSRLDKLEQAK